MAYSDPPAIVELLDCAAEVAATDALLMIGAGKHTHVYNVLWSGTGSVHSGRDVRGAATEYKPRRQEKRLRSIW